MQSPEFDPRKSLKETLTTNPSSSDKSAKLKWSYQVMEEDNGYTEHAKVTETTEGIGEIQHMKEEQDNIDIVGDLDIQGLE